MNTVSDSHQELLTDNFTEKPISKPSSYVEEVEVSSKGMLDTLSNIEEEALARFGKARTSVIADPTCSSSLTRRAAFSHRL